MVTEETDDCSLSPECDSFANLSDKVPPSGIIVDVCQAPLYLRRPYILRGYRIKGTKLHCLKSLFTELDNETLNAWTMICGAALSTMCLVYSWVALFVSWNPFGYDEIKSWSDVVSKASVSEMADFTWNHFPKAFVLLWLSCVTHTPWSVGLHSFIGISEEVRRVWRTLDVFFIQLNSVMLGVALGLGELYYCENFGNGALRSGESMDDRLEAFYSVSDLFRSVSVFESWTAPRLVMLGYTCLALIMFFTNIYSTMLVRKIWSIPKKELSRDIRNMVVIYLMPVWFHAIMYHSMDKQGAALAGWITILLWVGGMVYATQFPERSFPGLFDCVGSSHNWMHVAAFMAHGLEFLLMMHLHLPHGV